MKISMRVRRVTLASGIAAAIVFVVAIIAWRQFALYYYLYQIRENPEIIIDMTAMSPETPQRKAASMFVRDDKGAISLIRVLLKSLHLESKNWLADGSFRSSAPLGKSESLSDVDLALGSVRK